MLVLSRKVGQELVIGDNIRIVVSRVAGNRVSLGIQAPANMHIIRAELKEIRDEFAKESPTHSFAVEAPLDLTTNLEVVTSLAPQSGQ